jgi:hypothetical protein
MHGQGWPRRVTRVGGGGRGGPGQDGEGQLLNCIVVEALAGVCDSEPEIECNMEFRIPLNWALMK